MIESLTVHDFQRWEHLEVVFDPKVTVLTGPSDRGKSSLLRLLRWIALNRPGGESFVRHDADTAQGILRVDGHEITRRRKRGGENVYALDGREFVAFGQSVPEDISRLLDLTELHFQRQHDPSYLFSSSPGEVARELNQVVNLALIDDALSRAAIAQRSARSEAAYAEQRLSAAQEQMKALSWAEEADKALQDLEEVEKGLREVQEERTALEALLGLVEEQQARVGEKVPDEPLRALEGLADALEGVRQSALSLEKLIAQAERLEDERCRGERSLSALNDEWDRAMGEECPLCRSPRR